MEYAVEEEGLIGKAEKAKRVVEEARKVLAELDYAIKNVQLELKSRLSAISLNQRLTSFNLDMFEQFLKKPYVLIPRREEEWYLIVPRFIDFQVGWLDRQTESYNVFIVNRYVDWLAQIPQAIREELDFKEPLKVLIRDDALITEKELMDEVWERYKPHLLRREGENVFRIRAKHHFKLIVDLVKDGILPFEPKPVEPADLTGRRPNFELREYQKEALEKFLRCGALGVYWMPAAGKTFLGLYLLTLLKGKKLIVVPTLTLQEQWAERIRKYCPPEVRWETEIITYHSAHKTKGKQYILTIFDEVQHLPANTFSRLAFISTKYRLGLSASPFREDGRTELIFALTGFPVGLDWQTLLKLQIVRKPAIDLIICESLTEKVRVLESLVKAEKRTIIFCDSIELGKSIARRLGVEFIYGATRARMEKLHEAHLVVVSRVGDEGISLGKIQRVIELDFLHGSRRQELQRFGRLFHSEYQGEHIILMTKLEYQLYKKRLYSIYERGFEIKVHSANEFLQLSEALTHPTINLQG